MAQTDKLVVRIERSHPDRWEEFHVERRPNANVISVLMQIQRNPVTADGKKTTPPAWDAACLEEVCGSCTMNINGKVRQACSTLIDKIEEPVRLQPMKKFPLVRDLAVDRQKMFDALKRVQAWVPVDGTYDLGPGPRQASEEQEMRYVLSTCMTCGCCLEVCPQVSPSTKFIGAAAISQVRLFNSHPTGALNAVERLEALMDEGGIAYCGNDQNCVRVCPKGIPLTDSIAEMNRQVNFYALKSILNK
jgi:succinate dehydrogenase / fumarate reductase iron-sulfur subunit